jgi:hypothetical protein
MFRNNNDHYVLLGIIACTILLLFLCSCSPQIKREDVKSEDCFVFLKCMEMNYKNPDKSSCMMVGEACRDAMRESRKLK